MALGFGSLLATPALTEEESKALRDETVQQASAVAGVEFFCGDVGFSDDDLLARRRRSTNYVVLVYFAAGTSDADRVLAFARLQLAVLTNSFAVFGIPVTDVKEFSAVPTDAPPGDSGSSGLSGGAIAGIVIGLALLVLSALLVVRSSRRDGGTTAMVYGADGLLYPASHAAFKPQDEYVAVSSPTAYGSPYFPPSGPQWTPGGQSDYLATGGDLGDSYLSMGGTPRFSGRDSYLQMGSQPRGSRYDWGGASPASPEAVEWKVLSEEHGGGGWSDAPPSEARWDTVHEAEGFVVDDFSTAAAVLNSPLAGWSSQRGTGMENAAYGGPTDYDAGRTYFHPRPEYAPPLPQTAFKHYYPRPDYEAPPRPESRRGARGKPGHTPGGRRPPPPRFPRTSPGRTPGGRANPSARATPGGRAATGKRVQFA